MDINNLIDDLRSRRESLEGLVNLARSIGAPESIVAVLDGRVAELETTLESAEEVNGNPRDLDPESLEFIHSPAALDDFARRRGLRHDWHEPDESEVGAFVQGVRLDNAMGACADPRRACGELNVILTHDDKPVAVVNLALVLAWACNAASHAVHQHDDRPTVEPEDIPF